MWNGNLETFPRLECLDASWRKVSECLYKSEFHYITQKAWTDRTGRQCRTVIVWSFCTWKSLESDSFPRFCPAGWVQDLNLFRSTGTHDHGLRHDSSHLSWPEVTQEHCHAVLHLLVQWQQSYCSQAKRLLHKGSKMDKSVIGFYIEPLKEKIYLEQLAYQYLWLISDFSYAKD